LSARRTWGEPLIAPSTIAGQRTIRARPSRTGRTRRWKAREAQRRAPSRFFGLAGLRGALIGRRQGFGQVMTRPSVLVHGLGVGAFGEPPSMLPVFGRLRHLPQSRPFGHCKV